MKIVYIAHPISGNIDANLADILRILRIINTNSHPLREADTPEFAHDGTCYLRNYRFEFANVTPNCPYYADILALDDNNALERKRGIDNDIAMINSGVYDELWLTGDRVSFGMNEEVKLFKLLGKPIIDYIGKF